MKIDLIVSLMRLNRSEISFLARILAFKLFRFVLVVDFAHEWDCQSFDLRPTAVQFWQSPTIHLFCLLIVSGLIDVSTAEYFLS